MKEEEAVGESEWSVRGTTLSNVRLNLKSIECPGLVPRDIRV